MPEINKHEIRSPELQEVMSGIPGSFLRWGLFLFFGIIIAILVVSWFISYPDVVTAPVTITTYNPPVSLMARSGGKIEKLFAGNGDKVAENQEVAIIGNQADREDVQEITNLINSIADSSGWSDVVNKITIPGGLTLGEIQNSWVRLSTLITRFKEYIEQNYIPAKIQLLERQILRQEEYITELKRQEKLSEEDLQLTINSYRRDSLLFRSSNYSITITEMERSKQAMLQKKVSFSTLRSSIKNTESSTLKINESLLDLKVQYEKEISQFNSDLDEAVQMLRLAIGQWKERFLIESPVAGVVTFTSFWSENQVINAGEILATVIPDDPSRVIVRAKIPVSGSGKVKPGQEVNIKLSGYPYMQYGVIKGRIYSISMVPAGDVYIAEIDLIHGMRSTYNREIGFINDMTGTADIITEDSRLIYRFIKPMKGLVRN